MGCRVVVRLVCVAERDRLKPAPPPKPAGLVGPPMALVPQRTYNISVTPEFFNQLTVLQKQSRDLRIEVKLNYVFNSLMTVISVIYLNQPLKPTYVLLRLRLYNTNAS